MESNHAQSLLDVPPGAGGSFYVKDRVTGKAESLGTADRAQAQHLLAARNQAVIQPQLNRAMARTYLMAKSG